MARRAVEATVRKPKHQEVFEQLREAIHSGKFGPGDRLPTESELVRSFRVSRTTINRALRDLQNEGVLTRRRGSGTYVQQKNEQARKTMGLILPALEPGSIFIAVQRALVREAESLGWSVMVSELPGPPHERDVAGAIASILDRRVNGVFYLPHAVAGPSADINRAVADAFSLTAKVPLVLLDRDIYDFPQRSSFDVVGTNNERGGYLVAEHLLEQKCKRILFFLGEYQFPTATARLAGFRMALEQHGVKPLVSAGGNPDSHEFVQRMIREHRPDGIVCSSDYDAAMVMRQLLKMGVNIPEDIRLAGFDDTPTAALLPVPLTTVRQHAEGIASRAVMLMRDRIARPQMPPCQVQVECELIVRASTLTA